jgi:hypothetical protein
MKVPTLLQRSSTSCAAFSAVRRVAQQHVAAYREAGFRSPAVALWSAVLAGGDEPAEG